MIIISKHSQYRFALFIDTTQFLFFTFLFLPIAPEVRQPTLSSDSEKFFHENLNIAVARRNSFTNRAEKVYDMLSWMYKQWQALYIFLF